MDGNRQRNPGSANAAGRDLSSVATGQASVGESASVASPLQDDYFEDVASSLDYGREGHAHPPTANQATVNSSGHVQPAAVAPVSGNSDQLSSSGFPAHFGQPQPSEGFNPASTGSGSPHGVPPYQPSGYPVSGGPPQPGMLPPGAAYPAGPVPDSQWPGAHHHPGYPVQAGMAPPITGTEQGWPPGYSPAHSAMYGVVPPGHQAPVTASPVYQGQMSSLPGRYDIYSQPDPQVGGDVVVPRISIQCFFERSFVQSTLVSVMRDRRMANVSMEIEVGGLSAAIRHYGSNQIPHLIVVESTAVGEQLLSQLDALANLCDDTVKVIVIGAANDVQLYRELKRRGVSEYLVPPVHPVQLIHVVSGLFLDDDDPFVGRSVAVCGARGGCGSSTLAHNLAWSFAERIGMATTLVDLDLSFGTVGLDFNQESVQSIADVLSAPDQLDISLLDRMVAKVSKNLSLLNAPVSLDTPYEFDSDTYIQVIDQVRRSVPLVVLDLPHVWTQWVDKVITSADDIVVVATPDLASLRNVQKMFKFFAEKRVNDAPPRLVLNMVDMARRPEIPATEFAKVADVKPAASIDFDARLFGKAANNGQMLATVDPAAGCIAQLDDLAGSLVGRNAEVVKPKASVIVDKVRQFLPGS